MDATTFNTPPPSALENELREKTARLNDLERQVNRLQELVGLGRRDSDFDLFYRRLQVAEKFSRLSPDAMKTLPYNELYYEFWQLAHESHRVTKFAAEEKNISLQILQQALREENPVCRQYLALALIALGQLQTAQKLVRPNLWSPQLQADFATFMQWQDLAHNPLSPKARAAITRNEELLAFLREKYSALIQKHSQAVINDELCPRVPQEDYQIYFCWLQGEDNLPTVVQCCYNSLKQNAGHYKVVFIDEKNFSDYVDIAPHIIDKFRAGKISRTHFSDILRINLLERHGGLWLDATILVTEPLENHRDFWQLDFYTLKCSREKYMTEPICEYISYGRWASFIQGAAIRHNPLFVFEKEFFNEYWREYDGIINYHLFDFIIALAYENIPVVRKEIDAVPINYGCSDFFWMEHLNDPCSAHPLDEILNAHFLNKLNWKIPPLDMTRDDTIFREIQRRYAPETIQK